jgi:hypothetical protein
VALELRSEHTGGFLGGPFRRVHEHDPAALASSPDLHLHLHDALPTKLTRRVGGTVGRLDDDAARRRDAVGAEQLLALMLVEIQSGLPVSVG